MTAIEQLLCEMAYIQGSLCRVDDGSTIRFRFYSMYWKLFLYVCRSFEFTVDGRVVDNAVLTVSWRGKTYPVTRLAGSDCSVPEGEIVELIISAGEIFLDHAPHRVAARFKSGGDYGTDGSAEWILLVAFTDRLN